MQHRTAELDLVKLLAKKIKNRPPVIYGIGDDAAVLRYTKNKYLLFTADMLIEEVDFTSETGPKDIGHKALASSISDIAAMGGLPKYALVSLGFSKRHNPEKFLKDFYDSALKLANQFRFQIAGGDLSCSKKTVVDVSVLGEVEKKRLVLRSGARIGDIILVSGPLGGSIYGRHLRFIPKIKEARYLVSNYKVNSMLDISDGLCIDLYRLTQAGKVGAVIYEGLIPVSPEAKSPDEALYMGEDFQLLFTLSPEEAKRLKRNRPDFRAIGEIRERRFGLKLITRDSKEKNLEPKGYQHF